MNGSKKMVWFVLSALLVSAISYSQERDTVRETVTETVSIAELIRVHALVSAIAEETAELRREMNSEETATLFIEQVIEFQKQLNPVIASIAETDAPKEAQVYAISLAIAIKETELSHWHYINAFVSREQRYLNSGDVFLREGLSEFARATSLADDLSEEQAAR